MRQHYKYQIVNNPNIPVIDPTTSPDCTLGEFFPTPLDSNNRFEPCAGSIRLRDMHLPNFSLREYQGHYERDTLLINEEGKSLEYVGVCLFLKGQVRAFVKDKEEATTSFDHSQNFKYDPDNEYKHFVPANKPFNIIHLSVRTDYYSQLLPCDEVWGDDLRTAVDKGQRLIGERFSAIIPSQVNALQTVYNCPLTGKLADMMVETALIQIILLQMHALFQNNSKPLSGTNKRDMDLIHAVRDHLSKNFLNDHSLVTLSREFGSNRNKLMSLFRQQFGMSIFDYITEERLKFAKELILQEEMSISQIAHTIGYKNANHFSTAFKKKYTVSPSNLRK